MNRCRKNIRKQFHFQWAQKYLGINLTKKVKDLYNENYSSLKKEIEENYRRLKDFTCSWIWHNKHFKNDYTTKSNLHVQ
jgi:hypothetical protein